MSEKAKCLFVIATSSETGASLFRSFSGTSVPWAFLQSWFDEMELGPNDVLEFRIEEVW